MLHIQLFIEIVYRILRCHYEQTKRILADREIVIFKKADRARSENERQSRSIYVFVARETRYLL